MDTTQAARGDVEDGMRRLLAAVAEIQKQSRNAFAPQATASDSPLASSRHGCVQSMRGLPQDARR